MEFNPKDNKNTQEEKQSKLFDLALHEAAVSLAGTRVLADKDLHMETVRNIAEHETTSYKIPPEDILKEAKEDLLKMVDEDAREIVKVLYEQGVVSAKELGEALLTHFRTKKKRVNEEKIS